MHLIWFTPLEFFTPQTGEISLRKSNVRNQATGKECTRILLFQLKHMGGGGVDPWWRGGENRPPLLPGGWDTVPRQLEKVLFGQINNIKNFIKNL